MPGRTVTRNVERVHRYGIAPFGIGVVNVCSGSYEVRSLQTRSYVVCEVMDEDMIRPLRVPKLPSTNIEYRWFVGPSTPVDGGD